MAYRKKFHEQARARFLTALRQTANVSEAARCVGMSGRGVYDARESDPEFRQQWDDAIKEATDRLEAEAWRRGVLGHEEPWVSLGKIVQDANGETLMRRVYSDRLLEMLLRGHMPQKYRDNNIKLDITVDVGDRLDQALRFRAAQATKQVIEGAVATAIEDEASES